VRTGEKTGTTPGEKQEGKNTTSSVKNEGPERNLHAQRMSGRKKGEGKGECKGKKGRCVSGNVVDRRRKAGREELVGEGVEGEITP